MIDMMNTVASFVKPNRETVLLDGFGPPADADALVAAVAANVRILRERAGLNLSELAQAAGVAKSTVSQLESGRANPNIETLWAVARALGVPFGRLIETPAPDVRVLRAGEGVLIQAASSPYQARMLLSQSRRGSFEAYVLEFEPGPGRTDGGHIAGTVEHVLVLQGRLRTGPSGAGVELAPGDLATFPGDAPHEYEGLEPGTRALLLMDYP